MLLCKEVSWHQVPQSQVPEAAQYPHLIGYTCDECGKTVEPQFATVPLALADLAQRGWQYEGRIHCDTCPPIPTKEKE